MARRIPRDESLARVHDTKALFAAAYGPDRRAAARGGARARADHALARATEIADEYENVATGTAFVRARSIGAGIVAEARQRGAEVIVMGGEPPSRVRGGAIIGGIGAARPDEIGKVTEYVLRKAPCRVLVTAPPEEEPSSDGEGSGRAEDDPEAPAEPSDQG